VDPLPGPWAAASGPPQLWSVGVSAQARWAAEDERLLDTEERRRVGSFHQDVDRDRYRVAHVALRRLLGAYLGSDPAGVELLREPCPNCGGPHGRPAVAGTAPHFSLSHSGDLVLLAFSDTPVGVDVELVPSSATVEEVATALHPRERSELAALAGDLRPASFARCWTRKEAYLKGTGTGLAESPSVTYVGAGAAPVHPPGWLLGDVAVPPDYAAACAVHLGGPLTRPDQRPSP
jgi:4'-phosphopantetheinyl transferase